MPANSTPRIQGDEHILATAAAQGQVLVINELVARGDLERCLIVCPGPRAARRLPLADRLPRPRGPNTPAGRPASKPADPLLDSLLHNPPPEFWRHVGNDLVDLDNDGDLDLVLGQIRDFDPTHLNQFSIVLLNDGTGYYPERIELPHPAFYDGYTSVPTLERRRRRGGWRGLLSRERPLPRRG